MGGGRWAGIEGGAAWLNNGKHTGAEMHKWAHSAPLKIAAQALHLHCSHMFYSAFSLLCPACFLSRKICPVSLSSIDIFFQSWCGKLKNVGVRIEGEENA